MNIWLMVLLGLSALLNVVLAYVLIRFSRRLLQFDELFELLARDLEVNVEYFEKLLSTPLFETSQEVKTANHNMKIISKRLDEFINRLEDESSRKLRTEKVIPNPPVFR